MNIMKFCSLTLFFMTTYNCYSCLCPTLNKLTSREIDHHSIAFEGTVLEIIKVDSLGYFEIKLEIRQHLFNRSNTIKNQEIILTTPIMSGMCRVRMEIGEQWFIFLKDDENHHVTECDRVLNIKETRKNKRNFNIPKEIRKGYRNRYKMYKSDRKLLLKLD